MARVDKLIVSFLLCSIFIITPGHAAMGDVLLSFEAQAHNTIGLTWVDGYLWNIAHGHDIPAELFKLYPTNGSEILRIYLPIQHVMGLTWDGSAFWAVSHQTSWIYRLDPITGDILHSFQSPNPDTVETGCEGMAWDGQSLWYADSDFDMIYKLSPEDGTQIDTFPSPGSKPQGLAYDGAYLWHYDLVSNLIYKIDPSDGAVVTSFIAAGSGQGDLAWDGRYLWISRNADDRIYQIDIDNDNPVAISSGDHTVAEGDTVLFNGSASYDPDGAIVSHSWDFDANVDSDGDGNFINDTDATGSNPVHIYGDNGVYVVTLEVTDNYGEKSTDNCIITVNNVAPQIDPFGPLMVHEGEVFDFNASASDPGSDDLNFTWEWGDGTSDSFNLYYNDGITDDLVPSPDGNFPFTIYDQVSHKYQKNGTYIINLTVTDDDGGSDIFSTDVSVIGLYPPLLWINTSQDKKDVVLSWDPPQIPFIDHYLIFRSIHQTNFDFGSVLFNTSSDMELSEGSPIPQRTMFNDTNAADSDNITNYQEQYYYTIKVVNSFGRVSETSRTVGKWTRFFQEDISTFSLPLEPLENSNLTADHFLNDMNASYIKWLDPSISVWKKHGDSVVNDTAMETGKGYEIAFKNTTTYTFCGLPGAMIQHLDSEVFSGFDHRTDAKNISVIVMTNGDVRIFWPEPDAMGPGGWYEVYNSTKRDGFFGTMGEDYFQACPPVNFGNNTRAIHTIANVDEPGARMYYMIVPFDSNGVRGTGTYSIGIWTQNLSEGYDTFCIPLKMNQSQNANWICQCNPEIVGANFFNSDLQMWQWHSTNMPEGVFDPILKMTHGYQVSTNVQTKFTFIGI